MSETDNNTQAEKPKTSKLAITKILASVIGILLILAIFWPVLIHIQEYGRRSVCAERLRQLGRCMLIYDGGDGEVRPTAEKWCDLFVKYLEVRPEEFICKGSDAKIGESSYALNKNVAGMTNSQISQDVVSLFETDFGKDPSGRQELLGNRDWYEFFSLNYQRWGKKHAASDKVYKLRWNQFDGPEILTTKHHKGEGCNVLFHDTHVRFVEKQLHGQLKWKIEENE